MVFTSSLLDVQQLKGQCKASTMCGRLVDSTIAVLRSSAFSVEIFFWKLLRQAKTFFLALKALLSEMNLLLKEISVLPQTSLVFSSMTFVQSKLKNKICKNKISKCVFAAIKITNKINNKTVFTAFK